MFYLELPRTSFLSGSQDAIMQKDGGELAPRGAIKNSAIYLFSKQPFVLIRSHNTLCVLNTALTKSKIWLHSHDSYLKFGVFVL